MALAASTRSVYRSLVRAGNTTFEGDGAALGNFRGLIRETFQSPTLTSTRLAQQPRAPPPPTSCAGGSSSSAPSTAEPSSTFNATQTPAAEAVESASPGEEAPLQSDSTSIDQAEYEAKLQHWRDVAEILRRNVVQGRATEETGEETAYRLRITKHTELGDNSTIKSPPKLPMTPFPNRNRRRRRQSSEQTTEDGA